ncbi:polyisoprenyl-teichoic acid--peptidoglycan teichoic acid transferase TagU [Deinococcus xinjiangensis]|uniref:Polyisoprenyl-teichoic acid--peptidoglycan teichoic acid transferase TagU n=1 Tax=Deinococcus xinjiangensis TaxID=457454 RepID=A0ABP9VA99_9DEIO
MRRPVVVSLLALAGLTALLAPAFPALMRYGALPHKAAGPLNIVLAGMDVDYDYSAATWPYPPKPLDFSTRTDTLLLAQVHPDGEVNLLSIPRDTWVNMAGYGWGKINGANVHGGPELLLNTVQQLTGLPIDGYLFMSLSAVRDLTNAVGGVTVDVPQRMKYDDNAGHLHIDLQAGRQKLSGEQAEGFLRFRHDSMSDIGRVGRQQAFLTALMGKLKSPLNWWRLPAAAGALNRNTKSNLTREQVGALLGAALSGPKVNAHTVPGSFGQGGTWLANRAELGQMIRQYFRDPNDPRSLNISVVNVAAPAGSARKLQATLQAKGYASVNIAEEPRHEAATTVSGAQAARIQQELGFGTVSSEAPTNGADVTIRLGSDTP